jgi:CBS domain-containing protein
MKLRELMTDEIECCAPQDSLVEAAQIMRNIDVGIVPVVEGDKLLGVVTDRDIVLRVIAEGHDVGTTNVGNCMTRSVITGTPDMDAHDAARLMAEHQVRRLPVVDNGRLTGMVAIGDLATVSIYENEAGEALSGISVPDIPHH